MYPKKGKFKSGFKISQRDQAIIDAFKKAVDEAKSGDIYWEREESTESKPAPEEGKRP